MSRSLMGRLTFCLVVAFALKGSTYFTTTSTLASTTGAVATTMLSGNPAVISHDQQVCVWGTGCNHAQFSTAPTSSYTFQTQLSFTGGCPPNEMMQGTTLHSFNSGTDSGSDYTHGHASCNPVPE